MIRRTKKERKNILQAKTPCRIFLNIWLGGFIGILMSYIDRVSHIHKQKRRVTDMTNKNIYQNIAARTGVIFILGLWTGQTGNLRYQAFYGSDGAAGN